jgi:hypothetical protein
LTGASETRKARPPQHFHPPLTRSDTHLHGFQMRHCRPAECRQVDAL